MPDWNPRVILKGIFVDSFSLNKVLLSKECTKLKIPLTKFSDNSTYTFGHWSDNKKNEIILLKTFFSE